jgi:hypothetical protein
VKSLRVAGLLLFSACAVPLGGADLRPLAGDDRGPVAVTISAAAASDDLLRHSEGSADDQSTLVLRLHLHNGSTEARTEEPARYRLNVVGADGNRLTGVFVAWAEGELPSAVPRHLPAGQTRPLSIPAGQTVTLSVAFRGLGGLPLSGAARIELVLPGERVVVVSAPATPAPRWTLWRRPRALVLRAGVSWEGHNHLTEIGMQLVFTRGPLIFGMTIVDHGDLVMEKQPGSYDAGGLGLFAGIQPREWAGVVAGADGLWGMGGKVDGVARGDLWLLRTYAAARFQLGHRIGVGGGMVPVVHGRASPLRAFTLDVGYSYTFVHGAHPDGGGLLVLVGAPLASF